MIPKIAGLIAIFGFVLLILTALFGSALLEVHYLDTWLLDAAETFFVLAVVIFFGWFLAGFVQDVREVR